MCQELISIHEPMPVNYLEISRTALTHNAAAIRDCVRCPIIAVLKCDGYGVSIVEAARIWRDCGAAMFAVSEPREALALRSAGFQEDILLLSPVADPLTLNSLLDAGIILTVTGMDTARLYSAYGAGRLIRVHIAVDTGMGRFGIPWSDLQQLKRIYSMFCFHFEGIFSHFAASFEKNYRRTKKQLNRFLSTTNALHSAGCAIGIRHIANSCAALRFPETRLDAVRIGSAFVGAVCAEVPVPLCKAGVLKAQVVDHKVFHPGDTTGYGSICKLKKETTAIVVAIGHENGFGYVAAPDRPRLRELASFLYHNILQKRRSPYYVEYNGQRCQLIGRIGSQYTLFDTNGSHIPLGAYVEVKANMLFPHDRRQFRQ